MFLIKICFCIISHSLCYKDHLEDHGGKGLSYYDSVFVIMDAFRLMDTYDYSKEIITDAPPESAILYRIEMILGGRAQLRVSMSYASSD